VLASLTAGDDVLIGPGVGHDVAVVACGGANLAIKADPITFATDRLGWYAIHVNANDLATVGAEPKWFLATLLLPEGESDAALVGRIMADMVEAADGIGVAIVGGHTEITPATTKPVVIGAMVGVVHGDVVRPDGLTPRDEILLTKGMAVEATAIIARELPERLRSAGLSQTEIERAAGYLSTPGISVLKDSQLARRAGTVHAMHDATEGGVATALDEMAEAAHVGLEVDGGALAAAVSPLTERVCRAVGLDPRGAISSGALLIGLPQESIERVESALGAAGLSAHRIARVVEGPVGCRYAAPEDRPWPRFARDEIARLFDAGPSLARGLRRHAPARS
jgi:hydrogenase maturation factor